MFRIPKSPAGVPQPNVGGLRERPDLDCEWVETTVETTTIDAEARWIRSGVTGRVIRLPKDVTLEAMLAARCADRTAGRSIDFFRRACRAAAW